jgi:hypothetical protein
LQRFIKNKIIIIKYHSSQGSGIKRMSVKIFRKKSFEKLNLKNPFGAGSLNVLFSSFSEDATFP